MDDPVDETHDPIPFSRIALSFEKGVEHLDGHAKHYARSAFIHLRKAWALIGVDEEMAAFRAITAEEEAASAIFMSLRKCGYRGANKLNPRNHTHKASLFPFIQAVGKLHKVIEYAEPLIFIDQSHTPFTVRVRLNAEKFIGINPPNTMRGEPRQGRRNLQPHGSKNQGAIKSKKRTEPSINYMVPLYAPPDM